MNTISYYPVSNSFHKKIYFIDSNILIYIAQYYYNGKCKNQELTEEIIELINNIRKNGMINYREALIETCFDYDRNQLDSDALNKFMTAIDSLIQNFNDSELISHQKNYSYRLKVKHNSQNNSIFNSNIPSALFENTPSFDNVFYLNYLYNIKLYSLIKEHSKTPIEKYKAFYFYMANEIDLLSAEHSMMAKMLFLSDSNNAAQKILKPKEKYSLKDLINPAIDITLYKLAFLQCNMFRENGKLFDIVFVTEDQGIKMLWETLSANYSIKNSKYTIDARAYSYNILPKYEEEFNEFENIEKAEILNRSNKKTGLDEIRKRIFEQISVYEKELLI